MMSLSHLLMAILTLGVCAYIATRIKLLKIVGGNGRLLHSLPRYHGLIALMLSAFPALLFVSICLLSEPFYLTAMLETHINDLNLEQNEKSLIISEIIRLAAALGALENVTQMPPDISNAMRIEMLKESGFLFGKDPEAIVNFTAPYLAEKAKLRIIMTIAALVLACLGGGYAFFRAHPEYRARNIFEKIILSVLIFASALAILTTIGIVFSMFFETITFFKNYSWWDFFFGTTWAPNFRGDSALSILPLLWGTLYISLVALIVAVPIGLLAAIYMSEYASRSFRAIAKPALEILAGIPTIVYGLFALVMVGPLIRDWIAIPSGLGNASSSVLTAGLVMGIMLIPFISSLSDDVINAVPQAMRDGSLGLGATPSETMRYVIVPAALPGIIASILLATSRAIGETMIVVLGAGAAAAQFNEGVGKIINPLEAMTTVTVKILSQLTGDTDFNSPETLVAFSLGLILFVITLILNFIALHVVRKYRERYE